MIKKNYIKYLYGVFHVNFQNSIYMLYLTDRNLARNSKILLLLKS